MTTISTMFSGGEGVGSGARMAGIVHLEGYEIDDKIAQVARNNNFDTVTADVLTLDPRHLPVPDILHASPVCTNASVANSDGEEAQLDIDAAKKVAEFIEVMKPKGFTLENVYPYRHFESFKIICDALRWNGYSFDYWHLNSANYGVPQTRKRLILIAKLDGGMNRIEKPVPTHHNPANVDDNQMSLFAPTTKPWVGWYEAIEDLIPFLPESQFADWQLDRLPDEVKTGFITRPMKGNPEEERGNSYYDIDYPAPTTMPYNTVQREFLFNGMDMKSTGRDMNGRDASEPSATITANDYRRPSTIPSAFMVDGKLNDRSTENPIFTIGASNSTHGNHKAFLVTDFDSTVITGNIPAPTARTLSNGGHPDRAWLPSGRVVKMTPRALARFQSFPEWYRFSDSNSLAVKVIGNAVPPLLYANVVPYVL